MTQKEELKKLLKEAEEISFREYCKCCYAPGDFCDNCHWCKDENEPSEFMSWRDMQIWASYEDEDWGCR